MTPGAHLYPQASDADVLAPMLYNVFPNKSLWGGYSPNIVFRWRPDGVDNEITDIYILKRNPKRAAHPRSAPAHWLSDSEPFSAAEELGALGGIRSRYGETALRAGKPQDDGTGAFRTVRRVYGDQAASASSHPAEFDRRLTGRRSQPLQSDRNSAHAWNARVRIVVALDSGQPTRVRA